jgi:hypothetical protein
MFASRLNYFFFGEHLTRKTYFSYPSALTEISPARTVYPGNYVTNFSGLKYIIPFGQLRLRMSGPTAGRLIQAEIKERFVSVNLPMLHVRTLQTDFTQEYRPGVEDNEDIIDLSDEFERQFFGDLLLFTVVKLSNMDVVINEWKYSLLLNTFAEVEQQLLELYQQKHHNVLHKCTLLSQFIEDETRWWNQNRTTLEAITQVHSFIANLQYNFDKNSMAYKKIQSAKNRQIRIEKMIEVLLTYRHDRDAWDAMLKDFSQFF